MKFSLLSTKTVSSLFAAILFSVPVLCTAGNPSQFASVEAMIKKFNDYSESNDTFKVLEKEPLHIQLSPQIVKGDSQDIIKEIVDRSLVYGIYRVFIHTHVEEIKVTSLPKEIDFSTMKAKDAPNYKKTIYISRKYALELVKKHLGVTSFAELVTEVKVGDVSISDQWTKDFKRLYYNNQGKPGLTRFVTELSK